jgi:1,4-dihydroxy-2-naphthoyl-CoA hydrolase
LRSLPRAYLRRWWYAPTFALPVACCTGGAYMAFADTLGAVGTLLNLPQGKGTTTTDSSTKFIAAAPVGTTIRAEAVALHRGRTTMVWQTSITNAQGKLCAVVTQTQLVLDSKAPRSADENR